MAKIKQFEDFSFEENKIEESITKFEDFEAPASKNEDGWDNTKLDVTGDEDHDDITLEITPEEDITPEEEDEMRQEESESEEIDEAADPLLVTSKDIMRIQDIVRKSAGNAYKAKKLAETMCKLITDKWKAVRRARAAEREGESELADVFMQRAKELGAYGA